MLQTEFEVLISVRRDQTLPGNESPKTFSTLTGFKNEPRKVLLSHYAKGRSCKKEMLKTNARISLDT